MKNTYGFGLIAMLLMTLTACTGGKTNPSDGTSTPVGGSSNPSEPYYKPNALKYNFIDLKLCSDTLILPSTGNQKILVIPVEFTDYPASSLAGGAEQAKTRIQKTFFGKTNETGWESVASYYEKSSYGKLQLSGVVTDWYNCGYTLKQANDLRQSEYDDATWYILRNAVNWYKKNHSDIRDYDQNGDGYIDAVWMVYSAPYDTSSSAYDIQWAYTFWDYEQNANKTSPVANVYAWASYDFIDEGGYRNNLPDAHTFIHETGHVLGLDDYYTYDEYDWGPAGVLDMMDGNIGDHNAYSKMVLDWTLPYVAQNTGTITLRPFESSGDCLLIGNDWNGSAFDEYLVLEYYTPTGLNQQDAQTAYPSRPKMFTQNGVKVYHIDSRLGLLSYGSRGWTFKQWTDQFISTNTSYTSIMASNTASSSIVSSDYRLVHLLESSGQNSFYNGGEASNATLFQVGDSFGKTTFNSFKFNDSTKAPFTFEITAMDNNGVTISFTKK